jgi:hypothetical protein
MRPWHAGTLGTRPGARQAHGSSGARKRSEPPASLAGGSWVVLGGFS